MHSELSSIPSQIHIPFTIQYIHAAFKCINVPFHKPMNLFMLALLGTLLQGLLRVRIYQDEHSSMLI